ncbi:hypothetical protein [Streptomyces sp. NPDC059080]|uniref:SbtR family transcriptional regulator n=1 Tax=Streptomyces sp. NPDC059080 TaxID=3346718 RepID=UPI00367495B7
MRQGRAGALSRTHAAMARTARDEADTFSALARFLERAQARAAGNRGLRGLMHRHTVEGTDLAPARQEIAQRCTHLMRQARAQGTLRDDVTESDLAPIATTLEAVLALPGEQPSDRWRRYLALILDGLRVSPDQAPQPGQENAP